ncbi:hypothetical protein WICPIJ_008857, partial [Wickerhamomyces pijperi]
MNKENSNDAMPPRQLTADELQIASQHPISLQMHLNNQPGETIPNTVDSGAGSYFISSNLVAKLGLTSQVETLASPVELAVATKSPLIKVTEGVQLPVTIELKDNITITINLNCYVCDKIQDKVYLGMPFVRKYFESIPWEKTPLYPSTATVAAITVQDTPPPVPAELGRADDGELEEDEPVPAETGKPPDIMSGDDFLRVASSHDNFIGMLWLHNSTAVPAHVDLQTIETTTPSPHHPKITASHHQALAKLLNKYPGAVSDSLQHIKGPLEDRPFKHRIQLIPGTTSTFRQQYRLSLSDLEELDKQVKDLEAQGFVRPSESPFNSPVLFVKKKSGELRLCVDYRLLNVHTIRDRFPMPLIENLLLRVGQASVFSKLDLLSGYHQIPMAAESREMTAFSTATGHYEWLVMPFGLTNAPSTFQRMMNLLFKKLIDAGQVIIYLDDILVFSHDAESHLEILSQVFEILQTNSLVAKRTKCEFLQPEMEFLGHKLLGHGKIGPDESKITTIKNWPTPTTVKQVQSFLGLCNFYRNFIDHYSTKALGLLNYVKRKDRKWTPCAEESFQALKTALTSHPVIVNPDFTNGQSLRLVSDASKTCLGYVLELIDAGGTVLGVVGYGSKKLQSAELNYPVREKELLAIIEGIKTFKHLLHRKPFTIHTDHESLKYWKRSTRELTGRLNNWLDFMSDYDFSITYIKGETNTAADALSRIDSDGADVDSPTESTV